jgi:hypothetical protein
MKTIGKLFGNEGINAATVLTLSGTLVVLMAKGDSSLSLKGMVSGVLSNPVPRAVPKGSAVSGISSLPATRMKPAA